MSKVSLVAGGAGFIGSNLVKILLQNGNSVICVDNLSTGGKQNVTSYLANKNYKFLNRDVCSKNIITSFPGQKIDEIYHLASPASVDYVVAKPVEAALANSQGTKNLLDLALLKKAKMLFASSSEIYGNPTEHPQKETYWGNVNSVGVRSGYDEGKRFGEALSMAYLRQLGLNISIARIFNTYGPRSSLFDGRVIPSFIVNALKNKPVSVHGRGEQTRSFCYVEDLVLGLVRIMESSYTGPFNLGNDEEYKIIDVAKRIINLSGSNSKIKFVKRPEDDPEMRRPDLLLTQKKLGWLPKVSLQDGLVFTIEYFKKHLNEN